MALVMGIGAGLFALILIWVIGIIACVSLSRAAGPLKNAVFGIGVLLIATTVVLLFYPRKTKQEEDATAAVKQVDVDKLIIPRIVLFAFMCVFAVVAFVFLLLFHWIEPIYSPALASRKTYVF